MDFVYLFTSLRGRINRAKWWTGWFILLIIEYALAGIAYSIFPTSLVESDKVFILGTLAMFYPTYAVFAKRFQDREKRGTTALYGLVPSLVALIAVLLLTETAFFGTPEHPNALFSILIILFISALIGVGIALWFLIELGLLKGTPGPNRFGPDPLGRAGRAEQKA